MAERPTVTVYSATDGSATSENFAMPAVFATPIRRDIIHDVHDLVSRNKRQPWGLSPTSGRDCTATSWHTGRAVARVSRRHGGGTGVSGSAAWGNFAKGGAHASSVKSTRRLHRHVNVNQRRYAIASALAATAVPALVLARGHRVERVPELPLVVAGLDSYSKTKDTVAALKSIGAFPDIARAQHSKTLRAGRGKGRNRRFVSRRGPLIVHADGERDSVGRNFKNLPGVDIAVVDRLNLLTLAPGGHMGRFIIFTTAAFERLGALYAEKKGYTLPRMQMANADLGRIINSTEIQSVLRPAVKPRLWARQKKNPLTNRKALIKLNPYVATVRAAEKAKATHTKAKGKEAAKRRAASRAFYAKVTASE